MPARRTSRPAVSLFEFLAVLVCAMGALILLLLVTTRRIRQQALAEMEEVAASPPAVVVADVPEPEVPATPPIVLATPDSDAPRWLPPPSVAESAPVPLPQPDLYAEAERQNAELRRQWLATVQELEERRAALEQNWKEWQATLAAANRAITNLEAQRQELDNESRALLQQQASLSDDEQRLRQSHLSLAQQIDATASQLEVVRNSPTPAASQYSILPYDYATGTTRRPIIIECTAREIRFASEEVILSAEDIQGFTPSYNPLQAGADALVQYWQQNDRESGSSGDPYILLVVRPGGTISYYIARKLLESVGDRFGYELVGEHQQFVWPETTPEATQLCRDAVEACIAERNRVLERVGGGNLPVAGPLQFMDSRGNFFLEEVAELQGSVQGGGTASSTGSGGGPEGRDLSAIFGDPVEPSSPGGTGAPAATGGRTHQLHQPPGHQQPSSAADQSGPPQSEPPSSSSQGDSTPTEPSGNGQAEPSSNSLGAGQTQPQGGGQGQDASSDSQRQSPSSPPSRNPSWIERPRGPDASPSYETHPGLFGRSSASGAAGSPNGPTRPLVIETANPSQGDGSGSSGGFADNTSPAPVVRGRNEPDQSRGTLGYQRDIYIYIDGTSFQVAGEDAVGITTSMSKEVVAELLAERLRSRIATWEPAPEGGTWVPRVRFEIRRGGNAHLRQMTEIVSEWQINWSANYTSE